MTRRRGRQIVGHPFFLYNFIVLSANLIGNSPLMLKYGVFKILLQVKRVIYLICTTDHVGAILW